MILPAGRVRLKILRCTVSMVKIKFSSEVATCGIGMQQLSGKVKKETLPKEQKTMPAVE